MKLSIILATTHEWPGAQDCLERLRPQLDPASMEVIIGDACPEQPGVPEAEMQLRPWLRTVRLPGQSVFKLRAEAVKAARGEIVALTEDHCLPAENWVEELLKAHENLPLAGAIGGAVRNGTTTTAADRANFLMTFSEYHPPLAEGPNARLPLAANLSFKRWALPPRDVLEEGYLELQWLQHLANDNLVALWPGCEVLHVQTHGRINSLVVHYHNGRSTTGLLAAKQDKETRARRWKDSLRQPGVTLANMKRHLAAKPELKPYDTPWTLAWVRALAWSHCLGELVGLVTRTAGRSPIELE